VIVRWGVDALGDVLGEVGIRDPLVVTTARWADERSNRPLLGGRGPGTRVFRGVRPHAPADTVDSAVAASEGADGLLAVGGGSAIDTAKAVSARTGLPVVSVPTTYSGAEWTTSFGVRDEDARTKGGGGGARVAGIV
jgi:maleylacetate reductase